MLNACGGSTNPRLVKGVHVGSLFDGFLTWERPDPSPLACIWERARAVPEAQIVAPNTPITLTYPLTSKSIVVVRYDGSVEMHMICPMLNMTGKTKLAAEIKKICLMRRPKLLS